MTYDEIIKGIQEWYATMGVHITPSEADTMLKGYMEKPTTHCNKKGSDTK